MIGFQTRHVPHAIAVAPSGTEVLGSQETSWATCCVATDVYVKSDIQRVAARGADHAEMRLARMNGQVACFTQKRGQALCMHRSLNAGDRAAGDMSIES